MGSTASHPTPAPPPQSSSTAPQPSPEDIPLTPLPNAPPQQPPSSEEQQQPSAAAAYFSDSASLYFGPHFIVNPSFPEVSASSPVDPRLPVLGPTVGEQQNDAGWRSFWFGRGRTGGLEAEVRRMEEGLGANRGGNALATAGKVGSGGLVGLPPWVNLKSGVDVSGTVTVEELNLLKALYAQTPPGEMQPTNALQSLTNLKKSTLRIVKTPSPSTPSSSTSTAPAPSTHTLQFTFDASAPCRIRIFYMCKEVIIERSTGERKLAYLPNPTVFKKPKETAGEWVKEYGPFSDGLHQKFEVKEGIPIDLFRKVFGELAVNEEGERQVPDVESGVVQRGDDRIDKEESEQEEDVEDDESEDGVYYYPLVIVIEALPEKVESGFAEKNETSINSQSTYIHLTYNPATDTCDLKVLKQKVMIDNISYTLQEIYGFTDPTGTGSTEPSPPTGPEEEDLQTMRECVICMSEPKDTAPLPCRHLSLCKGCAEVLRNQGRRGGGGGGVPKCPICRQVFGSLLMVNIPPVPTKTGATEVTGATGGGVEVRNEEVPAGVPTDQYRTVPLYPDRCAVCLKVTSVETGLFALARLAEENPENDAFLLTPNALKTINKSKIVERLTEEVTWTFADCNLQASPSPNPSTTTTTMASTSTSKTPVATMPTPTMVPTTTAVMNGTVPATTSLTVTSMSETMTRTVEVATTPTPTMVPTTTTSMNGTVPATTSLMATSMSETMTRTVEVATTPTPTMVPTTTAVMNGTVPATTSLTATTSMSETMTRTAPSTTTTTNTPGGTTTNPTSSVTSPGGSVTSFPSATMSTNIMETTTPFSSVTTPSSSTSATPNNATASTSTSSTATGFIIITPPVGAAATDMAGGIPIIRQTTSEAGTTTTLAATTATSMSHASATNTPVGTITSPASGTTTLSASETTTLPPSTSDTNSTFTESATMSSRTRPPRFRTITPKVSTSTTAPTFTSGVEPTATPTLTSTISSPGTTSASISTIEVSTGARFASKTIPKQTTTMKTKTKTTMRTATKTTTRTTATRASTRFNTTRSSTRASFSPQTRR
ncbi:hypothetical protein HDV05_005188 [Chytridiales sp. JEL 0842]|nr:hypothetical protein HDV05_005188 [Chytridiales sp. JEL 0842]